MGPKGEDYKMIAKYTAISHPKVEETALGVSFTGGSRMQMWEGPCGGTSHFSTETDQCPLGLHLDWLQSALIVYSLT